MLDEKEPSVQSADRIKALQVWSWGNMICIHQNLETDPIAATTSENK